MSRRTEAKRMVKLLLIPRDVSMSDDEVPDCLVSDSMIDRFLEIEPPLLRSTIDFDVIIEEIERTYVLGALFSAVSSSVVAIERMLNAARAELHKFMPSKIKALWGKGATDDWQPNINALRGWKYLSQALAEELSEVYKIRCRYLHSGDIANVKVDSVRSLKAAYNLLNELIGFPSHLFKVGTNVECNDASDPLVRAFYTPSMEERKATE